MELVKNGSCLCGAVSFEVAGSFECFFLCHCQFCQKDTGSAHSANLFSSTATLKWHSGNDKVRIFQLPLTKHVKSFCTQCGSALPNVQEDGLLVVPAGSLDDDVTNYPNAHIFVASRANWDIGLDEVIMVDRLPI